MQGFWKDLPMDTIKTNQFKNQVFFENLVTIKELSLGLQVPEKTIRDWVYKRRIPFCKVGNLIRFRSSEIEAWLVRKETTCTFNP